MKKAKIGLIGIIGGEEFGTKPPWKQSQ